MTMIFKRKIYSKMLEWKENKKGRTALLIRGARRIGKSTIAEEFAKKEYRSYIKIDFANTNDSIRSLFDDLTDLDYFFTQLQFLTKTTLYNRESVIIFDEIQSFVKARQAIKYLVQDNRYDYIETGSLISIKQNVKNILIPSEETKVNMYPMDFEEFSDAIGKNQNLELLKTCFEKRKKLSDVVNRQLMRDFRLYMLIGGMPQAVLQYIETKNFMLVDQVKREILELYLEDLVKIDTTNRAKSIFLNIPNQLSKRSNRFKVSSVVKNQRAKNIENIIENLKDSMTINICYNLQDPNVGMGLSKDIDKYKIFLADTGLFVTLAFWDKDFTENSIYEKLLSDKLSANLGYVYENMVAQILRTKGFELYYHSLKSKTSNISYEVDFIISSNNKICPIEVKSSNYIKHTSLDFFIKKFSSRIDKNYLIYTKDLKYEDSILMIPIYMTMFI